MDRRRAFQLMPVKMTIGSTRIVYLQIPTYGLPELYLLPPLIKLINLEQLKLHNIIEHDGFQKKKMCFIFKKAWHGMCIHLLRLV